MEEKTIAPKRNIFRVGQDWATVIGGFGLIIFVLFSGYK
jgi:hypothetical protein